MDDQVLLACNINTVFLYLLQDRQVVRASETLTVLGVVLNGEGSSVPIGRLVLHSVAKEEFVLQLLPQVEVVDS